MKNLKISNFFRNNSSTILTVIGSVGVVATAVMSARDTVKAVKRINYQRGYQDKEFNAKEKIKIAAPCYIPTVLTGVSTILCICGANKFNKNIQKSLTSAYIMLDQSYKEYRKSVEEIYGEEGDMNVIKNISDKKAEELNIVEQDDADVFFDVFSLQFFKSKMSTILEAEKIANEMLATQGYITLKTMYSLLGMDVIETDYLLGWSIGAGKEYDYTNIKIDITPMAHKDGSRYYILEFKDGPTEDYVYYL